MMISKRAAGFTRFEFAVVVAVFGIVAGILLERLLAYQEYAEKTAMEATVANIRTGLRMRVADVMMRDRMGELDRIIGENPISWLEKPPPNYVGELAGAKQREVAPGSWYFDISRRELVYLPNLQRYFASGIPGESAIRFRVTAVMRPAERRVRSGGDIEWVSLTLVNQYVWGGRK